MPGDGMLIARAFGRSLFLLCTVRGAERDPRPLSAGPPDDIQRMADLTNSALAPMSTSDPPRRLEELRLRGYESVVLLFRVVYPASVVTLIAYVGWALARRRPPLAIQAALAALLLLGSLAAFSLTIAVCDILLVPILAYPEGYNRLGYIPLAVIAAYAVALTSSVANRT
jgi:hypothetical protein